MGERGHLLPQFLGDERDEGVGQPQDGFQHAQQGVACATALRGVLVVQFDLGGLEDQLGVDLGTPQRGGRVGGEEGVAGT